MKMGLWRTSSLSAAILVVLTLGSRALATEETVVVARNTIIPVIVTKEVRVGGAGDAQTRKVTFEVAEDVVAGHHVIAKKGDTVEGHLTTAKNTTHRIFSNDSSSEVVLAIDDIVNFCGDTLHMKFERTLVGGSRGGFMSMGTHAHDAVFDKGIVLKATTDRVEKKVCSEPTSKPDSVPPPGMMVPDEEVPSQTTGG